MTTNHTVFLSSKDTTSHPAHAMPQQKTSERNRKNISGLGHKKTGTPHAVASCLAKFHHLRLKAKACIVPGSKRWLALLLCILLLCSAEPSKAAEKNGLDTPLEEVVSTYAAELDNKFIRLKKFGPTSARFMLGELDAQQPDLAEFDNRYAFINGAYRTNVSAYIAATGTDDITGAFIANTTNLTNEVKRIVLASEPQFKSYARAAMENFLNTYLITKDNFLRIYEKAWALEVEPDHNFSNDVFYYIATPQNDPEQEPKWTPVYYDAIYKYWMTSLITPLYHNGTFIGIAGHDVILNDVYSGIEMNTYGGRGYSFIFDSQKNIIIHPAYIKRLDEKAKMGEQLSFRELDEKGLSDAIAGIDPKTAQATIKYTDGKKEYLLSYVSLKGIDWHYGFVVEADRLEADGMKNTTIIWLSVIAVFVAALLLALLTFVFRIIRIERNTIFLLMAISIALIAALFILTTFLMTKNIKSGILEQLPDRNYAIAKNKAAAVETFADDLIFQVNDRILSQNFPADISKEAADLYKQNTQRILAMEVLKDDKAIFEAPATAGSLLDKGIITDAIASQAILAKSTTINGIDALLLTIPAEQKGGARLTAAIAIPIRSMIADEPMQTPFGEVQLALIAEDDLHHKDGKITRISESIAQEVASEKPGKHHAEPIDGEKFDIANYPFQLGDTHLGIAAISRSNTADEQLNKYLIPIWIFALSSMLMLAVIGIVSSQLLTRSLNDEIRKKTASLENANRHLEDANKKLQQLDSQKDEFISLVAHELKTPLTSIRGFTQVLQEDGTRIDAEKYKHLLSLIEKNTDQLYTLVLDIVDSSRISLGKLKFNIETIDPAKIIEDAKENLSTIITQKGLDPQFNPANGLPKVKGDYERTMQIIRNLVTNSVKFTTQGSIIVSAEKNGPFAQFCVADTGQGIPEENKQQIFSRFYQVDSTLTRKTGGSGLGLSICKGLAEGMGGKIWFTTEIGKGTKFYFTLPLAQEAEK